MKNEKQIHKWLSYVIHKICFFSLPIDKDTMLCPLKFCEKEQGNKNNFIPNIHIFKYFKMLIISNFPTIM